jgi:hypothetical protein
MTKNLSSGGVAFLAETPLPAGYEVEIFIRWPALPPGAKSVELHVRGKLVRCTAHETAVRMLRHEFIIFSTEPEQIDVPGEVS